MLLVCAGVFVGLGIWRVRAVLPGEPTPAPLQLPETTSPPAPVLPLPPVSTATPVPTLRPVKTWIVAPLPTPVPTPVPTPKPTPKPTRRPTPAPEETAPTELSETPVSTPPLSLWVPPEDIPTETASGESPPASWWDRLWSMGDFQR